MDWIRRNWPDLLIGVALFSVITGIVATLLSGGTILPTSSTDANNDFRPSTEPSPSYLSSVTNELTNVSYRNSEASPVSTDDSNVIVVRQNQRTTTNSPQSALSTSTSRSEVINDNVASNSISVIPTAEPRATPTNLTTDLPDSSPEVGNLANNDSKIYKISVGAFGESANARRLVAEIDNMGYKAGIEQSGNFSVVYVGPFPNRQQADNVASQLKASNYEASIYAENTSTSQSATSQPTQTQPTTNIATNQVAATPRSTFTPSVTSSGNSYLQVGAYRSGELSTPQSNQLAKLGFRVMEYKENGFVKLLLGPYDLNEVETVKAQLTAQGIDSFPRSITQ